MKLKILGGMLVVLLTLLSCKEALDPESGRTDLEDTELYTAYAPIDKSALYQVSVNGKPLQVWREVCHDMEAPHEETFFHTALFEYAAGAQITIVSSAAFTDFVLSPKRFNIETVKNGNTLTFTIPAYYNYTLVIPGQEPLMLFGAPSLEHYKTARAVVFGKGVHTAPEGLFRLESNTIYYLEEGAILNGKVLIQNVQNVKLIGRGYIDDRTNPARGNFLRVYNSENVELKGFGIRHAAQGWQVDMVNSQEVQASHLNLLSFGLNNDGLDLGTGCSQVHFEHCFIGAGDDGFGWHATDAAGDGEEPLTDCTARNCIIWKGKVGHGIRIGSSLETSAVKNLHFKDIDIVRMAEGRAIVIPHSDWAEVTNIVFEGIRDEKPDQRGFFTAYIKQTEFSNPAGYRPGQILDIRFIDCVSNGANTILEGYDEIHKIRNITFENVSLAGRAMQQSDIEMNEYVENVVILNNNLN